MAASVRCAHRAGEAARAETLLDQIDGLKARVTAVLDRAETENNPKLALKAARELRGCLDLLGRVMGDLNPATTTVNVLLSQLQNSGTTDSGTTSVPHSSGSVIPAPMTTAGGSSPPPGY